MRFANPRMLWLLWITLPLLSWFLWWAWRKKQSLIRQFVQSRLLAHLTVGVSALIQKTRLALLGAAVSLLILTLARPQWGFTWEEAKQRGLDIVVAIDTSRSMLAQDLQPNRLERAKLAALDLMRLAKSDRLGLAAFAGTAFLQCPLTLDEEAFRQSVNALDVGIIPQGGTALAEAIETSAKAFKEEGDNHKVVVLFTDGEDHEEGALEAAQKAARSGVRIFTVGVGTANGELLRQRDENGAMNYIKDDQGNVVKSRLNESLLTQIATAAQGFYLSMSGASTVDVLYQKGLAPLPKGDISSKLVKRYKEQFQWLLALAIVLLALEMFLPDRKRVQRTEAAVGASANEALRKAVAILLLGLWAFPAFAAPSPGTAQRKYEAGKFKEAEREYQRLIERKPNDSRLQYNAGTAAYQAKDFSQATNYFGSSLLSPDLDLQQRSYYNLGNSLFRLGEEQAEPPQKMAAWEQSLKHYERALNLNTNDADAKFNRDFVQKKLEELKQQQSQSKSSDQNKGDDKDQKEQQKDQEKQNQQQNQKPDQSNKPQDQSDKKEQPPKSEPQPKEKPENQKKQDQPQNAQNKEEKDPSKSKDNAEAKGREKSDKDSPSPAQAVPGQMTQEQVQRLLDAQKNDEKAMIFVPQEKKQNKARIFKDW